MEAERQMLLEALFSVCLLRQLLAKEKAFFQKYVTNIVKIDKIRKVLWRNHQNWNFYFCNFLLRDEACIKNKEIHDKEQKNTQISFTFTF